jgi:phage/plasmid primase-like uncharacterized protein
MVNIASVVRRTTNGDLRPDGIADLKIRTDLVEIASRYTVLKPQGRDLVGRCPIHGERTPSFKINLQRQAFHCFGCGAKGDVFDLVAKVERVDIGRALRRVRELVGGAGADPRAVAERAARMAAAAALEAQEAAKRKQLALRIWGEAEPLTMGSPELPLRYLMERRKITAWQPGTLRWHPACPWGMGTAGCLMAPVHDLAGDVTAIWRIKPVLEGKVERRGLGPMAGGCCRLVDAGTDVLVVAEGVEDALAAWALTTYPAWAALSAGNMAALELPPEHRAVLILADADDIGRAAAHELARRLHEGGREARVLKPLAGKDPNEVLTGRAA